MGDHVAVPLQLSNPSGAAAGSDTPASTAPLPRFARTPVLAVAGATGLLLLLLSNSYGYLSDELYFLAAGKYYLDWGYMDQQPLVPLLARGLDALFPGSLIAFRFPALVVTLLGIVMTALITREFGGDRVAQTLAAAAYPLSPWLLLSGHWLAAATLEPLEWATIIWLVVRWVRLRAHGEHRDRLLLGAGIVAAIGIQTKFLPVLLCAALLLGFAIAGPRAALRRPALWAGAGIAITTAVPTLIWQAVHHWPALDMGTVIDKETSRTLFLPNVLLYSGIAVGAALCCYGLWQLFRAPAMRPYRFLGWAAVAAAVFYLLASGRENYLAGLYGPLFAAATVGLQRRRQCSGQPPATWLAWPVYLVSALLPVGLLPIYPLPMLARHPEFPSYPRLYETGWPELADTVARTYLALPPEVRKHTAVIGQTYYITGALDCMGRGAGLPRAYSPHRGYWFFGAPPESADVVLYAGSGKELAPYFRSAHKVTTVKTDLNLVNIARGVTVTQYEGRKIPWSQLWPKIRTM